VQSLWLAVAIAGKLKAVIGSMDKIADGSLQLEEPKHNEKNDITAINPSASFFPILFFSEDLRFSAITALPPYSSYLLFLCIVFLSGYL